MNEELPEQKEALAPQDAGPSYVNHIDTSLDVPVQNTAAALTRAPEAPDEGDAPERTQFIFQKPLRTFRGDIADALKSQNMSVARIAIAEKVKKEKITRDQSQGITPPSSVKKNILIFLLSIILVAGGAYLLYVFYYLPRSGGTVLPALEVPSIVMPDTQKEISLDANATKPFVELLRKEEGAAALPQNSIVHFYITRGQGSAKKTIDSREFLSLLHVNAPDQYLRTLDSDFMFGVHGFNGNNPFIVLRTGLYQSAFAGMLKWEETLADDLNPLFSKAPGTATAALAPAESTAELLAARKPFVDLVIKNKDVRALTNQYDRIVLLYTFLDKETILITTNEFTLKEVLDRITNRRLVR